MVKYKIRECAKTQTQEPEIELELRAESTGEVNLIGHSLDNWKCLLVFETDGTIYRPHAADLPGLQTNDGGRIALSEEEIR